MSALLMKAGLEIGGMSHYEGGEHFNPLLRKALLISAAVFAKKGRRRANATFCGPSINPAIQPR